VLALLGVHRGPHRVELAAQGDLFKSAGRSVGFCAITAVAPRTIFPSSCLTHAASASICSTIAASNLVLRQVFRAGNRLEHYGLATRGGAPRLSCTPQPSCSASLTMMPSGPRM
jgi:hypothetical protein